VVGSQRARGMSGSCVSLAATWVFLLASKSLVKLPATNSATLGQLNWAAECPSFRKLSRCTPTSTVSEGHAGLAITRTTSSEVAGAAPSSTTLSTSKHPRLRRTSTNP
jgi:hypothetical protein